MICRFIAINNRWQCTDIYPDDLDIVPAVYIAAKIAWLNCTKRPPRGFCKRPHNYL